MSCLEDAMVPCLSPCDDFLEHPGIDANFLGAESALVSTDREPACTLRAQDLHDSCHRPRNEWNHMLSPPLPFQSVLTCKLEQDYIMSQRLTPNELANSVSAEGQLYSSLLKQVDKLRPCCNDYRGGNDPKYEILRRREELPSAAVTERVYTACHHDMSCSQSLVT